MRNNHEQFQPNQSYLRVATACPEVFVGDVASNVATIIDSYEMAADNQVSLVTFPELSITGYTLGDMVNQTRLLGQARDGLQTLAEHTIGYETAMIVGLPLQVRNRLYNCAAVLADGEIKGIVPKTFRPNYNEFYEQRWYDSWQYGNTELEIEGATVPFGTDMLFTVGDTECGVEICEDLWVMQPPSSQLAAAGAQVIANPSASPEQVGKAAYRRHLVAAQSARLIAGYVYAGCDTSESTAEIVMGGHQIISANGQIVAERRPFGAETLTIGDIDVQHLAHDRRRIHAATAAGPLIIKTAVKRLQETSLASINRNPFLPVESDAERTERLAAALEIQAHGLARRLNATSQQRVILGLSGGLDSTLALLVAHQAAVILGRTPGDIITTLTMPGPASSETTQSNAGLLANALGIPNVVVPIGPMVNAELTALQHDGQSQDVTYENVQARARTSLLFNYGNLHHGLVLGTGDLSEIALGWCTYNADQQSHYNVNASIPKTLVRHLVNYAANLPDFTAAKQVLADILATPISPELTTAGGNEISQTTEDILGPYELHDFFLYHVVRWGDAPDKIQYLAEQAFAGTYTTETIADCLQTFCRRFVSSQFKRETMPNGPKVGSVSLSPRGDWRMPPDMANAAVWQ